MAAHESPDNKADGGSRQILTFVLGAETYGLDILRVQEIRGWSSVTKIPYAPAHVLGVLNLRGSIVPIIDLRMRFALERAEYTAITVIIVVSVNSAAGRREFGIVVDGVSDVVDVNPAEVKAAPDFGVRVATRLHSRTRLGGRADGRAARYRPAHRHRRRRGARSIGRCSGRPRGRLKELTDRAYRHPLRPGPALPHATVAEARRARLLDGRAGVSARLLLFLPGHRQPAPGQR